MAETSGAVYVYGVLRASEQGSISILGVEGSKVGTIEHGELAALISQVEGDALAAAREVRAHWRVLEKAAEDATVLPVRFGTVMESEDAVRERLLKPNTDHLIGLLRSVEGRVQLNVKGHYDEERLLRDVVHASPAVAELRERIRTLPEAAGYYQRIRLGELVAGEVARRRQDDTRQALEALGPFAVAVQEEESADANAAFSLAFLVQRDHQGGFTTAVSSLAEELGERIEIRYVGPMPPYSFAQADLSAGSPAWA